MTTVQMIEEWEKDFKDLLLKEELLGKDEWTDLFSRVRSIHDLVRDEIEKVESLPTIKKQSLVDSLGLGPQVLEMMRSQVPIPTIANVLSAQVAITISSKDIEKWVIEYNKDNGGGSLRPSVFETSSRLEDIHELIFRHIEYVESLGEDDFKAAKTTKAQVMLEVYKELRMLYKDANQLMASIKQMNSIQEFQQSVLEVIKDVSLTDYHLIMKKLNEKKALMSAFTP